MLASRSSLRCLRPVTGTVRTAVGRREGREGRGREEERGGLAGGALGLE